MNVRLVFLENPKTGTTTLTRSLKLFYMFEAATGFNNPLLATGYWNKYPTAERIKMLTALPLKKREQVRIVFADTCDFGVHASYPSETKYLSLVREPMARMVSEINYEYLMLANVKSDYPKERFIREDVRFDNFQTRIFAGATGLPYGSCSEATLVKALENIEEHFFWIGINEFFEESVALLSNLLNRKLVYFSTNVNPKKRYQFGQEDSEYLRKQNIFDARLYDILRTKAESLTTSEVSAEVTALRRRNKRLGVLSGPMELLASLSHASFYPKGTNTLKKALKSTEANKN